MWQRFKRGLTSWPFGVLALFFMLWDVPTMPENAEQWGEVVAQVGRWLGPYFGWLNIQLVGVAAICIHGTAVYQRGGDPYRAWWNRAVGSLQLFQTKWKGGWLIAAMTGYIPVRYWCLDETTERTSPTNTKWLSKGRETLIELPWAQALDHSVVAQFSVPVGCRLTFGSQSESPQDKILLRGTGVSAKHGAHYTIGIQNIFHPSLKVTGHWVGNPGIFDNRTEGEEEEEVEVEEGDT